MENVVFKIVEIEFNVYDVKTDNKDFQAFNSTNIEGERLGIVLSNISSHCLNKYNPGKAVFEFEF